MTIQELKDNWVDEPNYHKMIHETFIENVNNDELLNRHRTWVEKKVFGFGERSFHWAWKLLLDALPNDANMLEIGVFRGQSISLWRLLKTNSNIYGITPLDETDGHWTSNYESDVNLIHDYFNLKQPIIYCGVSQDKNIIEKANSTSPYDLIYIDGNHTREVVDSDMYSYPNMVKNGGYLVIDDCCCNMAMPWGFFQGIEPVTNAVLEWEKTEIYKEFEFQFNVVHLRVYKRVA